MDQTKSIELQKNCLESAEERMAQLDKENEAATAKQRTLANESCERRAARLECMRQTLEAETPEQSCQVGANEHSPAAASGS